VPWTYGGLGILLLTDLMLHPLSELKKAATSTE
jgi:hypothetical protein